MATNEDYNGWKNKQTWNVALGIGNDEGLYNCAVSFMKQYKGRHPYSQFICSMGMKHDRTPDRIGWHTDVLDYEALNEMMRELIA